MSKFTRKRGEQIRGEIQKRERQYSKRRIDETIERGYEHLYNGNPVKLVRLMNDILIPELGVTRFTIRDDSQEVTASAAELFWDHESVRRFVENPGKYLNAVQNAGGVDPQEHVASLYLRAAGMKDPRERRRETIRDAFHSLESLAVTRGYVSNSVTNWAPAMGYSLQLGTWYQPPRDDMPYQIQLVDPGDSEEVTVNMGKPGRGKGVAGHTETEDRYHAGRKIVDLVDFDECEGGVYDLPNRNPTLRQAREDMGLPPDFTEHPDYDPPEVEIMVPLTENVSEKYIPYYGDGPTDTVVNFFTVPASRLSKRALKRFIASELTPTQVDVFEAAYDEIQRSRDDWNLHDLIHAVERHRGLHGNQGAVDRVQRSIRRIQAKGWIRDREDPNCIDWTRILTNPDTITVFTASLMDDTDEASKYLFHSYVIYALRTELKRLKALPDHERDGWSHVPKVTAILRELHKIAPTDVAAVDDSSIKQVQDAMTDDFRDLTAMHRHEGVEVSSDTQNFVGEIKARARKNYNRACLFQVNLSDAERMFREISGVTTDTYPKRVTQRFGVGECAVLGRVGTGRPFEMTVSIAPPMSHHFDPDEWYHVETGMTISEQDLKDRLGGTDPARADPEGYRSINSGWDLRVYVGGEEYRPARELLDATSPDDEQDQTDLQEVRAADRRPEHGPGQFAWDCLEIYPNGRVILDRLEAAYESYADEHGLSERFDRRSVLCRQIRSTTTPEDNSDTFAEYADYGKPVIHSWEDGKHQTAVYRGVKLNDRGEEHAPEHDTGNADAEPGGDGGKSTEDAPDDGGKTEDDAPEPDPEPELETVEDSVGDGLSLISDTDTPTEDPDDPAMGDMDCCSAPVPIPMYAGEERDEQVGWKCEACGAKQWG